MADTMSYRQWRRERQCVGKIRYSGRTVAANAATALSWIGRRGLEPYSCPWCDHWHVGHKTGNP